MDKEIMEIMEKTGDEKYSSLADKMLTKVSSNKLLAELKKRGIKQVDYTNVKGQTIFKDMEINNSSFMNINPDKFIMTNVIFTNCNFYNSNFQGAKMTGVIINNSELNNVWKDSKCKMFITEREG